MKKNPARKNAPVALLKGTTLVDSPRSAQPGQGRLSFIDSPEYGAGYLVVGDDILIGMQKTFLDNLQEHSVVALEDGSFRVDLRETRVGLRLTRDELDFLLSRREAEGFRIDSPFQPAEQGGASTEGGSTQGAVAERKPSGGKAKAQPAAKGKSAGAPSKGNAKSTAKTTSKTARKAGGKPGAKGGAQPVAAAAEGTPQAETAQATAAKGRSAKAPGKTAAKAAGKGTSKGTSKGAGAAQAAAPKAAEPVSLDAHRKRKQGDAGKAQAELPGLSEPLRKAARSAALDQSIREPRAASTGSAKPARGKAAPAGGTRRQGKATAAAGGAARGATTARSNARTQVKGTAAAKGRAPKAETAGAAQGGTATSAQVKEAARAVIGDLNRPVPRQELLQLVQERLGASVPGKSPVDNLVTILYKDPDQGFENIKSRGFWIKGQNVPAA